MRRMIVCVCNSLSEADIRQQVAEGVRNFDALRNRTGCSGSCGCCEEVAREVFSDALSERKPFLPVRVSQAA
ncbi:MAG TPA: (2Fe-2S)-binding protein [Rhodanobacteraceae bacterium]|nr:(2Fe-2S)-binding protein [Rhodanobacteraceae bacterium]